jgi:hypothetical protein
LLNLQELHCTCLRVLDYQDYCLSVFSDFSLAIILTISFVSSLHFPVSVRLFMIPCCILC